MSVNSFILLSFITTKHVWGNPSTAVEKYFFIQDSISIKKVEQTCNTIILTVDSYINVYYVRTYLLEDAVHKLRRHFWIIPEIAYFKILLLKSFNTSSLESQNSKTFIL